METEEYTLNFANELRKKNIHVVIEMNQRKIKKCFEWADKQNTPCVIVIGENEMKKNCFMAKNMKTSESKEYSFDNIEEFVNDIKNM